MMSLVCKPLELGILKLQGKFRSDSVSVVACGLASIYLYDSA